MKKKDSNALWAIDGSHYLYRSYFAITGLAAPDGMPTNAIFGFIRMVIYLMEHHGMHNALIAWDRPEPSWRKEAYELYKAHREEMPDDLAEQIPHVKELLSLLGFAQYEKPGYEADDIMYSCLAHFEKKYPQIVLVTNDKDLYQLIDTPKVIGFHPALKVFVDEAYVIKKYGVQPEQMHDYLTLLGDSSDGIPGVPGVGAKTAASLLTEHGTLKNILKNKDKIKLRAPSLKYIQEHEDEIWKSYDLIGLKAVPKLFDKDKQTSYELPLKWGDKLYSKMESLGFTAITHDLERLSQGKADVEVTVEPHSNTKKSAHHKFASVSVTHDKELVVGDAQKKIIKDVDSFIHDIKMKPGERYITYDLKRLLHVYPEILPVCPHFQDVMLLEYLQDPAAFKYNDGLFHDLHPKYWTDALSDASTHKLYTDLEFPLISVLFEMEQRGIIIDKDCVEKLKKQWNTQLEKLAHKIHDKAGMKFNILSPKQLGEVLYEKCGLPILKKKKTGPSTDASTLSELAHMHPIVKDILEYRGLAKLVNTYTDALVVHADNDSVLHTELLQYGTASGRLSSRNPNLQNIPQRSDQAASLRECFRPRKGYAFLSSDYSQIELRILVHFSQCKALKKAFLNQEDIHASTAEDMFGKAAKTDPKMRTLAKAINFGILYGQTPFGLSKMVGIDVHEAKEYIDRYYKKYPEVRAFQEAVISRLMTDGYVETLYGRIRKFTPEELSAGSRQYQHTLRAAFNTVLQGSAADLIKSAMLKTHESAKKLNGYQVMQIHDELIFEFPTDMCDKAKKQIKIDMENVVKWEVPVAVVMHTGSF